MPIGTLSLGVPLALDGESITGSSTAIAVLSVVSIVGGYLLLFVLWYFVFRDKSSRGDQSQPGSSEPSAAEDDHLSERHHRIKRPIGVRFPRR